MKTRVFPMNKNEYDQPIGQTLESWQAAKFPPKTQIIGSYAILEPLNPAKHARKLFDLFNTDRSGWTYLPYGSFDTYEEFHTWLITMVSGEDPLLYTILDKNMNPIGMAGYLHIVPNNGSIEIGHLHFSHHLKKTPIATEAMYLMMKRAFDELGYRRYEWKCDALNQPSRNAAERLGFKFEGIFRQHMVYKNRSRDTAWFSIIDNEWPALKSRFQKWLSADNVDDNGNQILSLRDIK